MSSETVSIQLGVENILKRMNHDISKAYGDFCDTGSFAGSIGSATYYVGITALNAFFTKEDVVFNFTVKNASGYAATKNTVYKFLDKYGIEDISDIEVEGDDFEQPEHSIRMSVFKVKVYISKDLFKKQARQYCTSSDCSSFVRTSSAYAARTIASIATLPSCIVPTRRAARSRSKCVRTISPTGFTADCRSTSARR